MSLDITIKILYLHFTNKQIL